MLAPAQTIGRSELLRLRALDQYQLSGAVADPGLEGNLLEISKLAAEICGAPLAGISLVTTDMINFLARVGTGPRRVMRGRMPCELTIQRQGVFEIADARYHPAFRPDGMVVGGRMLRFYAGAPLTTPTGAALGALFVQSANPHLLSPQQKAALTTLARQVMAHFELHARARTMDTGFRDRHRVESQLTVERNFVSTVLDTVGALVAVFDTAGRIVRFNRTCELVTGYDFSALVGRYLWEELIPEEDIQDSIAEFERLRAGQFPANFENHWQHRDGSLRRIAWSATALLDEQGNPNFIIATGIDVTEQRAAEATITESEARYRELVEGSLGMICTHSLDGIILSVNIHGAEALGRTVETMVGRPMTEFMPAAHRENFGSYLRKIADTGEAQGRMALTVLDGEPRIVAFRNKLIDVDPERGPYVLGFGVDISEQVRAEMQLRTLTDQSNSILESVGDGIYGVDLEGRVTVINPAASQMLGFKPDELLGAKLHELIQHTHADGTPHREAESTIHAALRTLDTVRVANEIFWRKDGTSFPVEYVARPQIESRAETPGGPKTDKPLGVVVAFRDTTDRRALDRMKDEFISTVSHELRTPLTSLRAALGLVTGGALQKKPERQQQMLEIAIGNTDRLIRLVNDFLDIERISSGNSELHSTMCAARLLFERAASLQQAAADKHNLRFEIEGNGVEVFADPDRILQALTNLISNAIKYSPPGAAITMTATRVDDYEARLDVHDMGRGIPDDKLESIFERFQQVDASDSRAMGGTGLGLAICRSIVAQHGGRIWATSPPKQGATFHLTLPTRAMCRLA